MLVNGCDFYITREIQSKLVKFGYKIKIDNVIDQEDEEAILDFQHKNGLKEGDLDWETLEALGLHRFYKGSLK